MDTGESTKISVNTIAQGKPDCFGVPVVTNSCAFFTAHEAAGAPDTRLSLRPHSRGSRILQSSDAWRREGAATCPLKPAGSRSFLRDCCRRCCISDGETFALFTPP